MEQKPGACGRKWWQNALTGKFEDNPKVWQQVGLQKIVHPPVALEKGNKANDKSIKSEILIYKGFSVIQ